MNYGIISVRFSKSLTSLNPACPVHLSLGKKKKK
jgi:hypothetical protein